MSKKSAEDKRLEKFLAGFGINPNAKVETKTYANPETFQFKIGTKIKEVASGVITEIVDIVPDKGILLKILNRGEPVVVKEWQSHFEKRINEGYLVVLKMGYNGGCMWGFSVDFLQGG